MSRLIGGVLALVSFIAVVAASAVRGMSVWDSVGRGLIAAVLMGFAGWLLFGPIGLDLAKEAALPPEPAVKVEGGPRTTDHGPR